MRKSIAKAMLALGLAVAWFVGTALAVHWMTGNPLWLSVVYGLPSACLYHYFQGPQIKKPSLLLLWSVVMGIGIGLATFELVFAASLLLNALGLL